MSVFSPWISRPCGPLAGVCAAPGDKSISHRALMLGACAVGETTIEGLLEADDVLATAAALRALGAEITARDGVWTVWGLGVGGLREPAEVLDLGNSGTGARLLIGLAAAHPFLSVFTGDASLRGRPMGRILEPLRLAGAEFWARGGDRLPIAAQGARQPAPISYALPVASAQIKSAVLLAGLHAPGETTVVEPLPSRDHTERMLRAFGAVIEVEDLANGSRRATVRGQPELTGRPVVVPGDVSSAAFPIVTAAVIPGSRIRVGRVGLNPLRRGLLDTLEEMGADIRVEARDEAAGEPFGDLVVTGGAPLTGVVTPPERAPSMIDEFPILAVAAACAAGRTRMTGLKELKVKESDRLAAVANLLASAGVAVEAGPDWLEIEGCAGAPPGGGVVTTEFDHRIAMTALCLGAASREPIAIDDGRAIATSFPSFVSVMNQLGAAISKLENDPGAAAGRT